MEHLPTSPGEAKEVTAALRGRLLARDPRQRSLEARQMKLAYHTIVAGTNKPLAELIPPMAEAGLEAIEADSATIRWFEPDIEDQIATIRDALDATGLELYSTHCPWCEELDWSSSDPEVCELAQGMMGSAIETTARLGARMAVLHPGRIAKQETEAAYVERLAKNIAPLVVTAKAEQITLALENMPYQREDTQAMANAIRLADSERLVVCLDTGHAHLLEGLTQAVAVGGGAIGHIHIHDNDGQQDQHLLPGEGTINWEHLAPLIGEDSDYQGAIVLEAHRPEGMSLADLHEKMSEFALA